MHKKLLISLAPMLATVSLVVMPPVAQAVPHWYVDGVKAAEGKTYPDLSWGTLTFANSNPAIRPLSCENASIGDYKNPTGGGAGEGATTMFAATDCVDSECPEEDGLELQMHYSGGPGQSGLVESGGKNLVEFKAATVTVGCYLADSETLVATPTTCQGNSDPEFKNGSGNLSQVASKVLFTGESDRSACTTVTEQGEVQTEGITEKSLDSMAYGSPVPTKKVGPLTSNMSQATLEVKNP